MIIILEYFREVVVQCVCTTILCSKVIAVKVGRLILDCCRVTYIVCSEAVETVVLLVVLVKTTLYLEVKVLDDMPCYSTVDCPVVTDSSAVIVSDRLERWSIVTVVLSEVRI